VEPLRHLPRLLRLRTRLRTTLLARRIDLFVGIDSPAFNLGLARALRLRGIPTAQYVSPQIWAWRAGRAKKIAAAVDAVLCLLPFEPAAYAGQAVQAAFVGHPLADQVPLVGDRDAARRELGIANVGPVVAVLPGSRMGEVRRLGEDFAAATVALSGLMPGSVHYVAPMASAGVAAVFATQVRKAGARIQLVEQRADRVLEAADTALVASGTATLQTMLHGCPMVVAYRLAPLTAFIARDLGLVKVKYFSLPNLLADEALVPEFFQQAVQPKALAEALRSSLLDGARRVVLQQRFHAMHGQLRRGGASEAARVLLQLLALPTPDAAVRA
jgi:lipid-A-disaccharide synthase